jgi:hypothetical protein
MEEFSSGQILLTKHAQERLHARRIPAVAVEMALLFGRESRVRGATLFAIGRREVEWFGERGVDLKGYEGIQVVCVREQLVVTVYRNRDFRGLRPRRFRRKRRLEGCDRHWWHTQQVA